MRLDDLPAGPELNAPYALASDQRAAFRRDGFIRLRQVFAPHTLTRLKAAISGATLARSGERKPMAKRSTYAKAFLPVTNLLANPCRRAPPRVRQAPGADAGVRRRELPAAWNSFDR